LYGRFVLETTVDGKITQTELKLCEKDWQVDPKAYCLPGLNLTENPRLFIKKSDKGLPQTNISMTLFMIKHSVESGKVITSL